MATELASGFISLSVRYASAMRQIDQDFQNLKGDAARAGTQAGNALSQNMGRASKLDSSDTRRAFSTLESSARRAGEDAGHDLGKGLVSGAKREVSSAGDEIGAGLGDGVSQAGGAAGTGFMAALGPKLASLGSKAGPIGLALTAAVGLAAVAGGLLAAEVFKGFERDMANRKLQVQLGIDPGQMAGVNEAINNAYKNNFGESIDGLREDAAAIIKNGLVKASDTAGLQTALQQFDTVAQVTGSTTEEISNAVSRLVKAGVVKDFAAGLDLVTVAGQKGLDTSGELLDTLTEYSVQFQKVGIDGQQSLGLIKQLMDGGARSVDLAADAIKEFSIRSIDGSKSTVGAYIAIGLNADEMARKLASGGPAATQAFDQIVDKLRAIQDPVERNTQGVALFGTQWEDLGASINNLDPSSARDAIGQVDGAVQKASDTLGGGALSGFESLGRSFEVIRGQFQDFLAKAFGPLAQRLSEFLTTLLPRIGDAFSSIMPAISDFFSGLKEGGAVLGGQWIDNVKTLWPEIQKLGSAMKDAFVAALPVLKGIATAFGALILVAMKITGAVLPVLVKGFTLMYQAIAFVYNEVVPRVTSAFQTIAAAAMALWTNAIQPAWQGIQAAISGAWGVIQGIFEAIKTAVSAIGSVFSYVFDTVILPMWHNLQTVVGAAWSVISPIFDGIGSGLNAVGSTFQGVFASAITPVWEGIKSAFSTGWEFLSNIFEQLKGGFQAVADFVGGVWNGIAGVVKGALDAVVNAIRGPLHTIGGLLAAVPSNLGPIEIPGAQIARDLGAKLQAFRTGGQVSGAGTGTSDSILAWLSNGEGVVTAQAMANGGATLVAALNNGWVPPVEMIRSMVGNIPGFAEGLNPGADFLRSQIMQLWPQITSIGGRRSEDGYGEHSSGNAIDVMIPGWDTPQGKALGDAVASFVAQNADALGANGMIWRQTSYGYGGSFSTGKGMSDRGSPTQNHMDHLHIIEGKGRGAGAPAVGLPTSTLSLPSGGAFSPAAGSSGIGVGGTGSSGASASPQQLQSAQDKITDLQNRLDTSELQLQETKADPKAKESALKSKQDAVDKNKRELDQAKQNLETLKTQTGSAASGAQGSQSDNPFSQILSGVGQLGDLAKDGLIESFLPPGFNNPLDGSLFKSASAILGFAGSITQDPTGRAILGIASQAAGGSPSGVINGLGGLLSQPFGQQQQSTTPGDFSASALHQGTGALPGPGSPVGGFTPDATGGTAQTVNNDNSVHVAEGGQINQNATQILDKTQRQQTAQQQPQLGTRRFI